jgi:3-oxoacyl-[acyl-carrier protein] reductase
LDLGLNGKRAWVLGASSGLGHATAAALAAEGARVVISSRSEEKLRRTASEIGAAAVVPLDVAEGRQAIEAACERVVADLGGLDILVSNHGGPPARSFDDVDDEMFRGAFDLVLASAFRLTKAALPHLRATGGGVIAYLTSTSTKEVIPNLLLSNVMRAGVVGLAKTLAHELGPDGVRVLCAAPGRLATDRLVSLDSISAERQGVSVEEVRRSGEASIPLGRYGDPAEFGDVVAFLCSERASYLSGITVAIDGGRMVGLLS